MAIRFRTPIRNLHSPLSPLSLLPHRRAAT
ncbi:MAG: hypothetical protein K0Q60_2598, partial [Microvirga sp.]|nr:hypothetical protein [Microvirga sp.]